MVSLLIKGDPRVIDRLCPRNFDATVAAHALAENGVLVTANLKHMARVPGLEVEDWSQKREV